MFDGHCGICAATFARNRLLDNIFGQPQFPDKPEDAIVSSCMSKHSLAHLVLTRSLFHSQREACLLTDQQFEEACSIGMKDFRWRVGNLTYGGVLRVGI